MVNTARLVFVSLICRKNGMSNCKQFAQGFRNIHYNLCCPEFLQAVVRAHLMAKKHRCVHMKVCNIPLEVIAKIVATGNLHTDVMTNFSRKYSIFDIPLCVRLMGPPLCTMDISIEISNNTR